jgi:hypothetical protein
MSRRRRRRGRAANHCRSERGRHSVPGEKHARIVHCNNKQFTQPHPTVRPTLAAATRSRARIHPRAVAV